MARYDERGGSRFGADDNRDRWRDDERSSWRSGGQGTNERDDERGFFQRAGDEIRSWFNEEDDGRDRDYERGSFGRTSWDRDDYSRSGNPRGGSSYDRDFRGGFSDRDRERGFGSMSEDRSSFGGMAQGGQFGRSSGNWDRDRNRERGFGPFRGGSSWNERDRFGASKQDFGGFRDESDFRGHRRHHPQSIGEANRGQSDRDRDHNRGLGDAHLGYGDFSGTLGGFGNQTFGSSQDDHYRGWRDRQMSQLDTDYADYCREREQQFNQAFDSWRRNRQSRSPSAASNASSGDLGAASNAGVGTTTSSMTGTAGAGSASGSATTQSGSMQTGTTVSSDTADAGPGGGGRSGSRSRS
jgi:hypothetical protein